MNQRCNSRSATSTFLNLILQLEPNTIGSLVPLRTDLGEMCDKDSHRLFTTTTARSGRDAQGNAHNP